MSFDLVLVYLKNGEAERIDNPIGILNVLREHCKDEIDKNGDYLVNFSDSSSIEMGVMGLEPEDSYTSCSFHLRSFTPNIISFVFRIAKAGEMVIYNAQGTSEPDNPLAIIIAFFSINTQSDTI